MKQEVFDKLEEAQNLITEAKYIIEDLASKYNILDMNNLTVLKEVVNLIKILSEIKKKTKVNPDIPIDGIYKMLYYDYKKALGQKKELQRDLLDILAKKELDKDSAMLNLKLLHAEREIEKLQKRVASKEHEIERLEWKNRELKRKLQAEANNADGDPKTNSERLS